MSDQTHPDYYGGEDDPYEAIKVIRAWGLNFALGSVLKYIRRHGIKPGESALKDMRKARDYIDDEIRALEAAQAPEPQTGPDSPAEPPQKPADGAPRADLPAADLREHLATLNAAAKQGALRVGARVRVRSGVKEIGREGIVTKDQGAYGWNVELDGDAGMVGLYFTDELEVIG